MKEFKDFVNLTPHEINVELPNGDRITISPSGTVLRLQEQDIAVAPMVVNRIYSLDPSVYETLEQDKTYLVSIIVLPYIQKDHLTPTGWVHYDFLAPDTGPKSVVRDAAGKITAVRGFIAP